MLRSYFKILLRNFYKSPLYFSINIVGFSLGILSCILIVRYVTYEKSYDDWLSADLYRVVYTDNDTESATISVPIGPALKQDISGVSQYCRFMKIRGVVKKDKQQPGFLLEDYIMGDGDFFRMFDVELLSGDTASLAKPGFVYLSESEAQRIFGNNDAIGDQITIYENNFGEVVLTVAGVFPDWPKNSHLSIRSVVSLRTLNLHNQFIGWAQLGNWGWNAYYTYVRAGQLPSETEMTTLIDKNVGSALRKNAGIEVNFQPVSSIHTSSELSDEFSSNSSERLLIFLQIMAFFILLIAAVNYINLTSARSIRRVQEVGIRKNLGASRWQLIGQFNLEALVMIALSLILAVTIYQLIQPVAARVVGEAFHVPYGATDLLILALFLLPVMFWASFQPSWLTSAFSISDIIKGKLGNDHGGKSLRSISVVVQLSISILLITSIFIIYSQMSYMQDLRLGMNIEHLLVVERPKEEVNNYTQAADAFARDLQNYAEIEAVSKSGSVPGRGFNWQMYAFELIGEPERQNWIDEEFAVTYVDNSFLDAYDISLLAGKAEMFNDDSIYHVLVNQSVTEILGISNPESAIGKMGRTGNMLFKIEGVIENYMHNTVKERVPAIIYILNNNPQYFTIRYKTGDQAMADTELMLNKVKSSFNQYFPDRIFEYFFMEDLFDERFQEERAFARLVTIFSLLAVSLSCMGLIGLSVHTLERRKKEMGIRKILGASPVAIFGKLSGNIAKLVLFAAIPTLPITYLLANEWLEYYPNKIELNLWYGLVALILLTLLALGSVCSQFYRLSRTNPVNSIRYE